MAIIERSEKTAPGEPTAKVGATRHVYVAARKTNIDVRADVPAEEECDVCPATVARASRDALGTKPPFGGLLLGVGLAATYLGLRVLPTFSPAAAPMGAESAADSRNLAAKVAQVAPTVSDDARPASPSAPRAHVARVVHFDLLAQLMANERRADRDDAWLKRLTDPAAKLRVRTQPHPLLDAAAPRFTLTDARGNPWSLDQQLARGPVVLVFYLGYGCNACVHGLCEANADLARFRRLGAEVVAISGDPPAATRQKFAEYGAWGFPVLADPQHRVAEAYQVFRPAGQGSAEERLHGTFLVDRAGNIRWAYCGETPFTDDMALLGELLQQTAGDGNVAAPHEKEAAAHSNADDAAPRQPGEAAPPRRPSS